MIEAHIGIDTASEVNNLIQTMMMMPTMLTNPKNKENTKAKRKGKSENEIMPSMAKRNKDQRNEFEDE